MIHYTLKHMKKKCSSCSTTNWADANVCVRCFRSLDAPAELWGFQRLEAQSDRKGMPAGVYVMMGLVAFFVVFVGIKMVKDSRVEAARIEAKSKADAAKAAADQTFWTAVKAASDKQMQEMNDKMKVDLKQQFEGLSPGLSGTKYDMNKWDPVADQPRPGSGGYVPPPPGTVYSRDKFGQMRQVR